ncbi:cytochrome C [Thiohalomonas denitrificans]|uniref:cytochrome C n=1 Tax=Thiohalomonas denitrificans TaxID=415747 RepID=UPI0026EAF9AF|nr:cytochrome C [Thiohalomonas denitrificans]
MPRRIAPVAMTCLWAAALMLFIAPFAHAENPDPAVEGVLQYFDPETRERIIPDERCLTCHGDENQKTDVRDDGSPVDIYVEHGRIEASVHGEHSCTDCHTTIDRVPHREAPQVVVGCVECHKETWSEHKDDPEYERLEVVNKEIENFMGSVHASPSKLDESRTNATCYDCHDAHNIGELGSQQRAEQRLKNPEICGSCHEDELAEYRDSDHGRAVLEEGDSDSAVCSDCHTTHAITEPEGDAAKLAITKNCGDCHQDAQRTYFASYHGQVHRLGYTNTAKCHDCHGGHGVKGEDDPTSEIHADNRLENCQTCHEGATESFVAFLPHGDADDRENYPGLWVAKRFMQALIIGVIAFFWLHVLLWLFREVVERFQGRGFIEDLDNPEKVYFRRFSATWRWIHGLFAISTMALILTGTTLLFSHTDWAKAVVTFLGGPQVEGIIHRTAAIIWLAIFVVHLTIALINIQRKRKLGTFEWFGGTSMLPSWKDLEDLRDMFKWFFGRGPRPKFCHWTYWQKFDYWAPFWGTAVIGTTGLVLFAPEKTALLLPGSVFNFATLIHAEEALLAAIFLNSVHFFNVHFRPERFPMSTTIFTGAIPIEEFKHDHRLEYERLVERGELEKHLVKRPSRRAELASSFITSVLIMAGLALLTLVLIGVMTTPN